jgi:hypothetical protein
MNVYVLIPGNVSQMSGESLTNREQSGQNSKLRRRKRRKLGGTISYNARFGDLMRWPALIALLLLAPSFAWCQTLRATCELHESWATTDGSRSATYPPLETFQVDFASQDHVNRTFKYEGHPVAGITIEIDIVRDYSTRHLRPVAISMAILASNQRGTNPAYIFEALDASASSTTYRKNWNLKVSKNIPFDNKTYIYTVHCWDSQHARPWP